MWTGDCWLVIAGFVVLIDTIFEQKSITTWHIFPAISSVEENIRSVSHIHMHVFTWHHITTMGLLALLHSLFHPS